MKNLYTLQKQIVSETDSLKLVEKNDNEMCDAVLKALYDGKKSDETDICE